MRKLRTLGLAAILTATLATPIAISEQRPHNKEVEQQLQRIISRNMTDYWIQKKEYFERLEETERNRATHISSQGLNLIKEYEKFSSHVYPDLGHPAIGYGHRLRSGENYKTITEEKATELLREDISWVEWAINTHVKVPLTQNQYNALSSLVYNIGGGAFARSDIPTKLNQGDYIEAAEKLKERVYANGEILDGLVSRRQEEYDLFMSNK